MVWDLGGGLLNTIPADSLVPSYAMFSLNIIHNPSTMNNCGELWHTELKVKECRPILPSGVPLTSPDFWSLPPSLIPNWTRSLFQVAGSGFGLDLDCAPGTGMVCGWTWRATALPNSLLNLPVEKDNESILFLLALVVYFHIMVNYIISYINP